MMLISIFKDHRNLKSHKIYLYCQLIEEMSRFRNIELATEKIVGDNANTPAISPDDRCKSSSKFRLAYLSNTEAIEGEGGHLDRLMHDLKKTEYEKIKTKIEAGLEAMGFDLTKYRNF